MKKSYLLVSIVIIGILIWFYHPGTSPKIWDINKIIKFNRSGKQYTFFRVKTISFGIPVADWSLDSLLKRSVLYLPSDIVRDGLPWFGAQRDDWRTGRESRLHQGIDIYGDSLKILAVSDGIVEKTGRDGFSGGMIKLDHGQYIKTVYIHLSEILVREGMQIDSGICIGRIFRPEGNARESQLHFEIQVDGEKQDPLLYIRKTYPYAPEINRLLNEFEEKKYLNKRIRYRALRAFK